jgi:D-arabinose 1-dehydrogenase-like Zn-dependent alcohol dehydrogenase
VRHKLVTVDSDGANTWQVGDRVAHSHELFGDARCRHCLNHEGSSPCGESFFAVA